MRHLAYLLLSLCLTATSVSAQWISAQTSFAQQLATIEHDSVWYVSSTGSGPTYPAGVFRFNPYGAHLWTHLDAGIDFGQWGNVTSFDTLGRYVFASTEGEAAYRSSDDGLSWQLNIGGPVVSNGRYLYGTYGDYLARSSDSGATWQHLPTKLNVKSYATLGWDVFLWTGNEIWRSRDTGSTWAQLTPPLTGRLFTCDSLVFIVGNGLVQMSSDSGETWQPYMVDTAGEFEYVFQIVAKDHNLFVGTRSGLFISKDFGQTWRTCNDNLAEIYAGKKLEVQTLGVFDSVVFVDVYPGYNAYYRPLRELIDTTQSAVREHSQLAYDSIYVYPNPASGMVSIESGGAQVLSVLVLNLLGEEMHAAVSTDRVDLSHLPSGTYFLRIATDRGLVMRKIVRE